MEQERFEQWAILEIMGHQKFAGFVSEQAIGGASFVRIDVPEVTASDGSKQPAFSKLFGSGSIYCITPVSEELARACAARFRKEPLNIYMQELYPPESPAIEASQKEASYTCNCSNQDCFCSNRVDVYGDTCKSCQSGDHQD